MNMKFTIKLLILLFPVRYNDGLTCEQEGFCTDSFFQIKFHFQYAILKKYSSSVAVIVVRLVSVFVISFV